MNRSEQKSDVEWLVLVMVPVSQEVKLMSFKDPTIEIFLVHEIYKDVRYSYRVHYSKKTYTQYKHITRGHRIFFSWLCPDDGTCWGNLRKCMIRHHGILQRVTCWSRRNPSPGLKTSNLFGDPSSPHPITLFRLLRTKFLSPPSVISTWPRLKWNTLIPHSKDDERLEIFSDHFLYNYGTKDLPRSKTHTNWSLGSPPTRHRWSNVRKGSDVEETSTQSGVTWSVPISKN